ncbi:MAG: ABC transporter ATP-binding protein [Thermoanaerobaculum sp.]
MVKTIRELWQLFDSRERRHFRAALAASVAASVIQVLGVGSIFPFVAVLSNPPLIHKNRILETLFSGLGFQSEHRFLLFLGVASLLALVASNVALALNHWVIVRFSTRVMERLSVTLLEAYLEAPYVVHLRRSAAELKRNILQEVERFSALVQGLLQFATGAFIVVVLSAVLVAINPLATLLVLGLVGGGYVVLYLVVRRWLNRLSNLRLAANRDRFKITDESLGGLKELKVLGRLKEQLRRFHAATEANARFHSAHAVISTIPRYLVELVVFGGLMLVTVLFLLRGSDVRAAIPFISIFAVAAYRMLPSLQQAYTAFVNFRLFSPVIGILRRELAESPATHAFVDVASAPAAPDRHLAFRRAIELRDVTFVYSPERGPVLQEVSLVIPHKSFVALVGETGAGKTTLADIILGLLPPSEGAVLVDGVPLGNGNIGSWQRLLGYVPQDIYLADDTIAANIAFGLSQEHVDRGAVMEAAKLAQIHDFIVTLKDGYETVVGHRGVRLSGGQRQRIGIARALYHKPEVLVLDEATSMLDGQTEAAFLKTLEDLAQSLTLIVIAHRLATVRHADRLFFLHRGRLAGAGTFDELLGSSVLFSQMAGAQARFVPRA